MTLRSLAYDSNALQRRVTLYAAIVGVVLASICAGVAGVTWVGWQWAIILFIAFDLVGGVVAMCLPPAIRKIRPPEEPLRPLAFTAFHLHPFVIGFVLPEADQSAMLVLYAAAVLGVAALMLPVPQYQGAVALIWCAAALCVVWLVGDFEGLEWFAPAYLLKLVGSHSVSTMAARSSG